MSGGDSLAWLIDDAARSVVPVDELLRRLMVIATRARVPELESWVQFELDGYQTADQLPEYRGPFDAHVLGHFAGPFQSQASNVPIGPATFPKEYRESLFRIRFYQGVSELETLAAADKGLNSPWPADALLLVQVLQQEGKVDFNGHVLHEAHQVVPQPIIVGILRTVRDRVMKLALRLEAENPHLGQPGTPAAGSAVGRDVQVIVNGGQPNIAIAGSGVTQTSTFTPRDRAGLFSHLRALGIEDDQLSELDDALNEDAADAEEEDTPKMRPGRRVLGWVGGLAMSAGTAASSSAGQEAAKAIGHYMGQI